MPAPMPGGANTSRVDRRFDYLRKQTEQQANAAGQQQQEDLQRKAASQGGLGSGAFIKLGQQQNEQLATQKQNALEGVESQRDAALQQVEEAQANRDFAKSEREAGQMFAQGERLGAQKFAAGESALQRNLSTKFFDKEMAFKSRVQDDQNAQFDAQFQQALRQFKFDAVVGRFNMDMAEKQFNKKDIMESLQNAMGYDPRTGGTTGGGLGTYWGVQQRAGQSAGSKLGF